MLGWLKLYLKSSRRRYIAMGIVVAMLLISLGVYLQSVSAATVNLVPSSTVSNAWPAGTAGCTTISTGHSCVDEGSTANTTDYIGTGTGVQSVVANFEMGNQAGVATATSLTVYMNAKSASFLGNAPNADTVTMGLTVGGVSAGTASVKTMTTAFSWYSVTFNGNWTQAQVDNMQASFTRTVVGGGNVNNADDDVQIASVYVAMTYTSPADISQVAYRWFGNQKTRPAGVFNADVEYGTSTNPEGVYATDLNGDLINDIIVSNVASDTISVLMGNGDGTFDARVDYSSGDGAAGIVTSDFDGDQDKDIVTANVNGGNISVLLNNGDGTFTAKVDYAAQVAARELAVGDLNGDQNLDLVVTGTAIAQYVVLMGNGDGTFDAPVGYSVSDLRGLVLADINSDQNLDLLAANVTMDSLSVLMGNGDGTFDAKVDYPTADLTYEIAIGDFNNDQKIDVVTGAQSHTSVSVLLGNGDGTFGTKVDYAAGTGSSSLKALDVNGDQYVDIVSVINNNADTAVTVLKGNGDGTFGTKVNYLVAGDPLGLAVVDTNGDSAPDLIVTNNGSATVSVLLNTLDYHTLGAINASAKVPADGSNFRLRVNLGITSADLSPGVSFKLRYQQKSGSCSTSPAAYADVTTSSPIRFYNDAGLADHSAYIATDQDPRRSGITAVDQTYDESNNFTSTATVLSGRDGLWDLSLAAATGLTPGTVYCLIVTKSDNSALNSYTAIPEISIPNPALEQSNYRFYQNANSNTPGSPLAAQNTKPNVAVGSNFRLRQLLRQTSDTTPIGASFKLQAAEKITTCSAGAYSTLSTVTNSGGQASTGFQQTAASIFGGFSGVGWWQDPANAQTEDGLGAGFVFSGRPVASEPIEASQFGFSIPANATIAGVEFKYKSLLSTDVGEYSIRLLKNGAVTGTNVASLFEIVDNTVYTKGSSSSLWGTTLTPSDINNAGFGIALVNSVWAEGINPPAIEIDYMSLNVHYTTPATVASFTDNLGVADGATIGVTANDPSPVSGGVISQTYNEDEAFATQVTINNGDSGMWDFALRADESLVNKTYCFRVVKSNDGLLANYAQYPEVTFTSAGPTLNQQLRGGQSVVNGLKRPFNW